MKIGNIALPVAPRGVQSSRLYLSVQQLAERWECTAETVHKAIKSGLPAVARDGVAYVPLKEVAWHEWKEHEWNGGASASGGGASRSSGTTQTGDDTDAPFGQIVEITLTLRRRDGSAITSKFLRDPGT